MSAVVGDVNGERLCSGANIPRGEVATDDLVGDPSAACELEPNRSGLLCVNAFEDKLVEQVVVLGKLI